MYEKSEIEIEDLKNKISKMSREEKIKMLLSYAKECYDQGYNPTKRGIRKKFHLEIYNYFRNIVDYHEKAGIPVSLRNHPREKAKEAIINYLKSKVRVGVYPNRKETEKALKIHFSSYFENLKELYDSAEIDYSLVEKAIKNRIIFAHTYSKDFLSKQKKIIRNFIRENVRRGIYPSVPYIQKRLNLSFYNLYNNILDVYKDAGVDYEQPSPILLGKKKEKIFTNIVRELFLEMGFIIERVSIESKISFNKSADMTIRDMKGRNYLVEIKAYRKDYSISKREFKQLSTYLKETELSKGIFITTSNTRKCNFDNILFINGAKVVSLLKKHNLSNYIKSVKWIQESRVNSKEKIKYKKFLKKRILDYVSLVGKIPSKREIEDNLRMDIRSVFGKPKPYQKLIKEIERSGTLSPRVKVLNLIFI